jgi:vacuole morphology and inheritance protein 14
MASVSDLSCVTFTNWTRTSSSDDEIQQSTALRWLAEFLTFAHEVMVPFTPRLVPAILPNLAHHVSMIQSAAIRTNKLLLGVIQKLPSPQEHSQTKTVTTDRSALSKVPRSPTPTTSTTNSRQSTLNSQSKDGLVPDSSSDSQTPNPQRSRMNTLNIDPSMTPRAAPAAEILPTSSSSSSRPHSPHSFNNPPASNLNGNSVNGQLANEEIDPFDYQATVNELTIQFLSEFEETRVAALKWLIMLHQKAPRKVSLSILVFRIH